MFANAGGVGGNEGDPSHKVPEVKPLTVSTPIPLESLVKGAEGLGLTVADGTENLHVSLYALALKRNASRVLVVKPAPGEDARIILLEEDTAVDASSYKLEGRMFGALVQACSISATKSPFLGRPFEGDVPTDRHMNPGLDLGHAVLKVSYSKDDPKHSPNQPNISIEPKKT